MAIPVASFTMSANPAKVNTTVAFTDTSTGTPTSWIWDFGDSGLAYTQNATHAYTSRNHCNKYKGTYTVSLTVINDDGRSSTSQYLVIIANDSIEDLSGSGTIEVLWIKPNRHPFHPMRDWEHNVEVYQYGEGITRIHDISSHTAHIYKALWTQIKKSQEYELLAFFVSRVGRYKNFWLPQWQNVYRLYEDVQAWDDSVRVHYGFFTDTFQGYERFFMELKDGSKIVRHIVSVTNGGDDTETFHLERAMDRNISQDDILFFGKLVLTRFDQDEIEFEHHTSDSSDCNLMASFLELTEEYTSAGGQS